MIAVLEVGPNVVVIALAVIAGAQTALLAVVTKHDRRSLRSQLKRSTRRG